MPICLLPMAKGPPIVIDKVVVLVGRHPDCDVVVAHSLKVSRKHCCLIQANEQHLIRDLGSLNGVWINKERIEREELMEIGDEIMIGDVIYVVQELKSASGEDQDVAEASLKETPYQQPAQDRHGPDNEPPGVDDSDEPIPLVNQDHSIENDSDDAIPLA